MQGRCHDSTFMLRKVNCVLVVLLLFTCVLLPHSAVAAAPSAFIVAVAEKIGSLDPANSTNANSVLVTNHIYDSLLAFRASDMLPVAGLATRWSASADGKNWTFVLRSGIQFHDGTPLNADAVVFNIQRWWDPTNAYHQGDFGYFRASFGGFKGDADCWLQDVRADGPLNVVITLSHADSNVLTHFASHFTGIASPAAIRAGTLAASPVGTGPYRFVSNTGGEEVRLEANPTSWQGAPQSPVLIFKHISAPADRMAALKGGAVQVGDDLLPAAPAPEIKSLLRNPSNLGYMGMNRAHAPLDNLLVRQAIAHAINKQQIIDTAYPGLTFNPDQFLPQGLWGRDPTIVDYAYNPSLAKSLLTQAGFTSGITTTLSYRNVARSYLPDPPKVAAAIKADLEAVGIHLVVQAIESSEFLNKVYAGQLDLFLLGWGADYPHPDNFFSPHFCANDAFGPIDATLCNRLDAARVSTSLDSQEADYRWASRRVHDTLPLIALANTTGGLTYRYDVGGIVSGMNGESYKEAGIIGADIETVAPATGGTVSFADAANMPTTAQVPPGAIDQPTTLLLAEATPDSAPPGAASAHHTFDLTASREGVPLAGFTFSKPVTLTIDYSDGDMVGLWENTLSLYYWDGNAWQDVAATCSPPSIYAHDVANNRIQVAVCHLSHFGLFATRWPAVYLPAVNR